MWDLTGKHVTGLYLGQKVMGVVEATYVNYGTQVSHHVVLDHDYNNGAVTRNEGETVIVASDDIDPECFQPSPFDDYAQGEYDCLRGYDAATDRSKSYYNGFANQYAAEQIATHKSDIGVTL